MDQLEKYLAALVLLELDRRRDDDGTENPVVLLARAGFAGPEIAAMLGKKAGTVNKAVQRAKKRPENRR
jgi:DNA-directed RNA polymerase specialized sigma24 family protein